MVQQGQPRFTPTFPLHQAPTQCLPRRQWIQHRLRLVLPLVASRAVRLRMHPAARLGAILCLWVFHCRLS